MTKFEELIDPELHAALQMIPPEMVSMIGDNPPQARAMTEAMMEQIWLA